MEDGSIFWPELWQKDAVAAIQAAGGRCELVGDDKIVIPVQAGLTNLVAKAKTALARQEDRCGVVRWGCAHTTTHRSDGAWEITLTG